MSGGGTGTPATAGSYTYTFAPSTSTAAGQRDLMRLMLGDVDMTAPIFADEELAWFWTEGKGNSHLAAHHACVAAASKYSKMADRTLGPMSISYSQMAESFRAQAKEEFDNATNSADVAPEPYSFMQETGDRDMSSELDDKQVPAKFYRDQYENYGETGGDNQAIREHWT